MQGTERIREFVETARRYIMEGKERQETLNMAIDYCIDHDILSAFLKKYRAEVLGILLEQLFREFKL